MTSSPRHLSLKEILQQFRQGTLRSQDVTECAIDCYNEELGAYRDFRADAAREMALLADSAFTCGTDLGPLQGIPVSVKDLYGLAGTDTYAGSPQALPPAFQVEGPVISTLRRQLAVFTGKSHTVEFAFGGLGVNSHWGTPRNPWDAEVHRVPGGSSCGAGVSLQEGSAWIALGSDTAGSVRLPASMTGGVGLKTSYGRWSLNGIFPLSPTLDTAGMLTRTVADALIGFAAIDPYYQGRIMQLDNEANQTDPAQFVIGTGDPSLWEDCEPGIAEAVEIALKELSQAGIKVVEKAAPETELAIELFMIGSVSGVELKEFLQSELPAWLDTADPVVGSRLTSSSTIDAEEYLRRRRTITNLSARAHALFTEVDVIACPTLPITPPPLSEVSEVAGYGPKNVRALRNTVVGNVLGLCGITLPVGLDAAGMPVGLQLLARHGSDARLLAIAYRIEQILGNARERIGQPPLVQDK